MPMSDAELDCYMEEKRLIYTQPGEMVELEEKVTMILTITNFTFAERVLVSWILELLCFTIHTPKGRGMYLKLLNHTSSHCPEIAQKYWDIFDNQENLKERYRI